MSFLPLIFVLIFVGGPLAFFQLTRPAPSSGQFRLLASIALGAMVISLFLRFGFLGRWGTDPALTWGSLGMIWVAWIGILALGAQRLRLADPSPRMRFWTSVVGAFGTAVPWFGLASARMMTG